MNKLNISEWKEFVIGDLFDIKRPNSRTVKGYDDGSIPFVSSGNFNNGIDRFVTPLEDEKLDKGNCITISPVDGSCFYQPIDFLGRGGGGSSIILLYNDNLNEKIGLFVSVIIRKTLSKFYQYNNMGSSTSIKQEKIKLPSKNNNPDWEYMEQFIDNLYKRERESICAVAEYIKKNTEKKLDVSEWREFSINELFEKIQQGKRLKNNDQIEGDIPFIMAGKTNNGIANFISNPIVMFPKNSITIDIFGNTFYQENEFSAGDDTGIYWSENNDYSKNVMLFFVSVIQKSIKDNYDFSDKLRSSKSIGIKVYLPVTKNNELNFDYMENYIVSIKNKLANFSNSGKQVSNLNQTN